MTGGATAGAGRNFRLDPGILPVRSATAFGGGTEFYLDRERAVFRSISGPKPETVTVPVADYDGVAVRLAPFADPVRLALELIHADPHYVLPLACGGEPDDVADDWQAWGRELGLPLLVVSPDGSVTRYEQDDRNDDRLVSPIHAPTRRRHSYFAARRPRFLKRRKVGITQGRERIATREIIART